MKNRRIRKPKFMKHLKKRVTKVLVTGAAGFIGSHLTDRLKEKGYIVYVLDKQWGTSTSDITNLLVIDKPDIIVHLGANCSSQISLRDPRMDFIDNALGTFNVCEYSRLKGGIPIIFNSTMKVYPGQDGIIPPYGISKLVGEMYLKLYRSVYNIPSVINRPSSVYGPRQDGSEDGGWFTWFIRASLGNKQITLFGDGTQSRDVLYIDDCVDVLMDEVENFNKYKNLEFDFGGGAENEVSLNQLLDELDYHDVKVAPKLQGDVQRFVCDNKDIYEKTGWKPKVNWKQGLKKTLEHFKMKTATGNRNI